jgi:translation elongation factor EF-G
MKPIDPFVAGSEDTPFSASRMSEIVDALNALRNMTIKPDGAGSVIHSDSNTIIALAPQPATTEGATVSVKMFKIQTSGDGDEKLTCKEWTGTAETGSSLYVAKPTLLRLGKRPGLTHVTTPAYAAGDIIIAVEPTGGTGITSVTWLDLNVDARGWGYELKFCNSGVAYKANFICGAVSAV